MNRLLITSSIMPPDIGGPASYVSNLCKELPKSNLTKVITFTQNPDQIKKVLLISINLYQFIFGSIFRQINLLTEIIRQSYSMSMFYAQDPVVVGLSTLVAGKLVNKKVMVKFVGDVPWEQARLDGCTIKTLGEFHINKISFKYLILKEIQKLVLQHADTVITPSNYLKQFLVNTYNVTNTHVIVVPNAIEIAKIDKHKKKKLHLVVVGRLVSWKNVDKILFAVNHARKQHPWHLDIVGDGPERINLEKIVDQIDANKWVRFHGSTSKQRTAEFIAQSQKIILYSDYEGMPHVLVEAMLLSTSIVASDIEPNRELITGFGELVPLNDAISLANMINNPIDNRKILRAKNYASKFNWNNHFKSLNIVVQKVLNEDLE